MKVPSQFHILSSLMPVSPSIFNLDRDCDGDKLDDTKVAMMDGVDELLEPVSFDLPLPGTSSAYEAPANSQQTDNSVLNRHGRSGIGAASS